MNELPRSVHMLGICGTAMTALAGSLQAQGVRVTGSDEHPYPPMSEHLAALGIPCNEGYRPEHIPADVALVIVGNVIREANPEAAEMRRRGLPHISMAEAVKRFAIGDRHTVAIVGTHGKTTTTSLAAHVLVELGADPGFLIGGIAKNFGSNFRVGGGAHFVIEGDEYDTAYFDKTPKFFKYGPRTLIFTSLEFDHADIYADLDAIRTQFAALLRGLPADGRVIACTDDPNVSALLSLAPCPVSGYGFGDGADCRLADWSDDGSDAVFVTQWEGRREPWRISLPGRHNALNAAAVIVLCRGLGHEPAAVQAALDSFQGVKRRQEVRGEVDGITVIDDFAHHPTAVRLTIDAIQRRYAGRPVWAVLEPRSFTARSRRFQAEFTEALAGAEHVLLAQPFVSDYSAGVERLDTAAIAEALRARSVPSAACRSADEVLERVTAEAASGDVVLIMSNGGFDNIHERLLQALRKRQRTAAKPTGASVPSPNSEPA
ncbi:MAG TPA: UDP-N-acetylmuramate--L-alanine ligase [bacterium]|nr:UDP-N-acetylmuramate--L-alanine ligase [bacterium]